MRIFLSYPSASRTVAEAIALVLQDRKHKVFVDKQSLVGGEGYDKRIKAEIDACDLLIFLITPDAVAPGRYTLTELGFAQSRWPSPGGRVLPVMIAPTPLADLPQYLKAAHILEPQGNVAAEVGAEVDKMRGSRVGALVRRFGAPLAAVAIAAGIATWITDRGTAPPGPVSDDDFIIEQRHVARAPKSITTEAYDREYGGEDGTITVCKTHKKDNISIFNNSRETVSLYVQHVEGTDPVAAVTPNSRWQMTTKYIGGTGPEYLTIHDGDQRFRIVIKYDESC